MIVYVHSLTVYQTVVKADLLPAAKDTSSETSENDKKYKNKVRTSSSICSVQ